MTCNWCHEFTPPNRKDGYCSDICQINSQRAEIERLNKALSFFTENGTMGLADLQQEIDERAAEIGRLQTDILNYVAMNKELRAALLRYGLHEAMCNISATTPCDCGFTELEQSLMSSKHGD
jgi:hypothetical protein